MLYGWVLIRVSDPSSCPVCVAANSSSSFEDELAWGALWLYQATGEKDYLQKAERFYEPLPDRPQLETAVFDWNDKRESH